MYICVYTYIQNHVLLPLLWKWYLFSETTNSDLGTDVKELLTYNVISSFPELVNLQSSNTVLQIWKLFILA